MASAGLPNDEGRPRLERGDELPDDLLLVLVETIVVAHHFDRTLAIEFVHGLGAVFEALEEIGDRDAERLGHVPQAGGADPVHAGLVLLYLLELDADLLGQLLLGHAQRPAGLADLLAHVASNGMLHCTSFCFEGFAQLQRPILNHTFYKIASLWSNKRPQAKARGLLVALTRFTAVWCGAAASAEFPLIVIRL